MGHAGGQCKVCRLTPEVRRDIELRRAAGEGPRSLASLLPGITERVVGYHFDRCGDAVDPASTAQKLGQIAKLLDDSGIPIEEIERVSEVSLKNYQGHYKDNEGESHIVDMAGAGIKLVPTWASGPEWPAVQPAAPTKITYRRGKAIKGDGLRRTLITPDTQIGYRRFEDGTLEPIHDEVAMACAMEIAREINPYRIVNLGDTLDFAQYSSKFLVQPEFYFTTQPAIDRAHRYLAEQRSIVGPDGELMLFEGNHDNRLAIWVARNFAEALRLRRAEQPDEWPVLSIENLLRLDDLDVAYVGGYPAGKLKLAQGVGRQTPLFARHGIGAGDVRKDAKSLRQSYVQGHGHHLSVHTETYEFDDDGYDVEIWSLGCLARLDGAVPGTSSGNDSRGRVTTKVDSWQHAVGILTEHEDGGWDLQAIRIRDGRACVNGKTIAVTWDDIPERERGAA